MHKDSRKVGIVGLGKVGITAAYALLLTHEADEIILVSRSLEKARGESLDLAHCLPFLDQASITATTDYAELADADVVIVTAGAAQEPGQSRIDLVEENKQILAEVAENLKPYVTNSVVVVVSNPVDVLTFQLAQLLNLPTGRVIGTGTMLDTARFRFHLSEIFDVHPRSIHAYVLGEHGETSFPAVSAATIGGQALEAFPTYSPERVQEAFAQTKEAAAQIIQAKGATYYAIGVVLTKLVRTILSNQRSVLPISIPLDNYYGQSGVAISVPCIVGRGGAEKTLSIQLSKQEEQNFINSCQFVRQYTSA
jgi:L-lactate dehydrogenase